MSIGLVACAPIWLGRRCTPVAMLGMTLLPKFVEIPNPCPEDLLPKEPPSGAGGRRSLKSCGTHSRGRLVLLKDSRASPKLTSSRIISLMATVNEE